MVDLSKTKTGLIYKSDTVDYQNNAVVSRTIIDKDIGSVTFFAFADNQGLSEHSAPYDALVYVTEGEAEIVISGKSNKLKKDEFIIMPANEPHSLSAITKFKMMLVMIKA